MSGKHEKEMHIQAQVMKKLEGKPSILIDYYYILLDSGKSYRTAKVYIENVLQFIKFTYGANCPEDFYTDVKPVHIENYMMSVKTKNVKGETVSTSQNHQALNWSSLNSFFQFLVPNYISSNPVANTKRPEQKEKTEITYLTESEVEGILDNINRLADDRMTNRDLCLFMIGFATGLQISTIVQINVDDLDLDNNRIKIPDRTSYARFISIGNNLKEQIMSWLDDRDYYFSEVETDALFISRNHRRLSVSAAQDLAEKYKKGVTDKNFTPNVMRNTAAATLYKKTHDIHLVSKQLNHKNIYSTYRYAEPSAKDERSAATILDDLF